MFVQPNVLFCFFGQKGLNGWDALTCMEVRSITVQNTSRRFVGSHPVITLWEAPDLCQGKKPYPPPEEAVRRHRGVPAAAGASLKSDTAAGDMDDMAEGFADEFMKPASVKPSAKKSVPSSSSVSQSAGGTSGGDAESYAYQISLRCAPWTLNGWSKDSPGCVWWYEKYSRPLPLVGKDDVPGRVLCGSGMIDFALKDGADPECEHVYLFHHRYALPGGRPETLKDKLTYHSAILLQWRHAGEQDRKSFTVVELATLNGCAGRGGKANWHDDKFEPSPKLSQAMPRRMKAPWDSTRAEVRCHDITSKSFEEFKEYVAKYTGPLGRFLEPAFTHDHQVRLSFRRKSHIMRYLLNYVGRDFRYTERHRNCQTFATDFYQFLAAKTGMTCYSNLVSYVPRVFLFSYDYSLFVNPNGVVEYSERYRNQ